jgi:putative ATP-dependent endonuclease of OLD family
VLDKIIIKNFRVFQDITLEFTDGINIVVGDNDTGKSTLLEAVNLALTSRLHGRSLLQDLSPHLFNQTAAAQYIADLRDGNNPVPPEIIIDLFLDATEANAILRGNNNSTVEDACGIRLRASFNPDYSQEYETFVGQPESVRLVPSEYYKVEWLGFSGNPITSRSVPATVSLIDAASIRLQSGADYHVQGIINNYLEPAERVELNRAYRSLREEFAENPAITEINTKLATTDGDVSDRALSLGIDVSQRSAWESTLVPHLDDLPFQYVGRGEQSTLKVLLALKKTDDAHVLLIEEPENHLAFGTLNMLVAKIKEKCEDKQVLIATHSSYVLNKLGLANLVLMSPTGGMRIADLPTSTQDYFQKLSGYDTLRLILAKQTILVEGPSDELIVQRAYLDQHGCLPIENGIDVLSVRGLSFKRFLDIAARLGKPVTVVTDHDQQTSAEVTASYSDYTTHDFIKVCVGNDDGGPTLEPQLLAANDLDTLNHVLGKSFDSDDALLKYMRNNKTTCAVAILTSDDAIAMPGYIADAIA